MLRVCCVWMATTNIQIISPQSRSARCSLDRAPMFGGAAVRTFLSRGNYTFCWDIISIPKHIFDRTTNKHTHTHTRPNIYSLSGGYLHTQQGRCIWMCGSPCALLNVRLGRKECNAHAAPRIPHDIVTAHRNNKTRRIIKKHEDKKKSTTTTTGLNKLLYRMWSVCMYACVCVRWIDFARRIAFRRETNLRKWSLRIFYEAQRACAQGIWSESLLFGNGSHLKVFQQIKMQWIQWSARNKSE